MKKIISLYILFILTFALILNKESNAEERILLRGIVGDSSGLVIGYFGSQGKPFKYENISYIVFPLSYWKKGENGEINSQKMLVYSTEHSDPLFMERFEKLISKDMLVEIYVDNIAEAQDGFVAETISTEVRLIRDRDIEQAFRDKENENAYIDEFLGLFRYNSNENSYTKRLNLDLHRGGGYYSTKFHLVSSSEGHYPKSTIEKQAKKILNIRNHFRGYEIMLKEAAITAILKFSDDEKFTKESLGKGDLEIENIYFHNLEKTFQINFYFDNYKFSMLLIDAFKELDGENVGVIKKSILVKKINVEN